MLKRYRDLPKEQWDDNGPGPMLVLNENVTDFYEITIDDFEMVNYDPIKPQLKLELGI